MRKYGGYKPERPEKIDNIVTSYSTELCEFNYIGPLNDSAIMRATMRAEVGWGVELESGKVHDFVDFLMNSNSLGHGSWGPLLALQAG